MPPGRDQPWYGNSTWGHPRFNRKSVCPSLILIARIVELILPGPSEGLA